MRSAVFLALIFSALTAPVFALPGMGGSFDELGSSSRSLLTLLNKDIVKNPNLSTPYAKRGDFYAKAGMLKEANADFDRALLLDKRNAFAYLCRADMHAREEEYEQAVADYYKCAEFGDKGSVGPAYRNAGRAQIKMRQYNEAVKTLTRAIPVEINPPLSLLERARAYLALKKYKEAIADISTIQPGNRDDQALVVRAEAELALNNPQTAIDDLSAALVKFKKRPPNVERMMFSNESEGYYRMRAKAYKQLGRNDLAAADLASAAKLQKDSVDLAPFR